MNTTELSVLLQKGSETGPQYGGVCAVNELPERTGSKPRYWVVNTAPHTHIGKHWTVIYLPQNGPVEFFDSLGRNPLYYHQDFVNFLRKHGDYTHNTCRIQGQQDTCGQYCLYFAYHRCAGTSMNNIVNHFTEDKDFNDMMVDQLIDFYYLF